MIKYTYDGTREMIEIRLIGIQETSTSAQAVVNVLKPSTLFPFLIFSPPPDPCRMSGNTAAMAALAPGPVLVPDRDLVHALAAEAGTTSSKAPQRY